MEIHKPKPWHNTREFLKEYLIIVVGVLTALGAEAVVERVHEHRLSVEARESVRAEINLDVTNVKRRGEVQACIDAKMAAIGDRLDAADKGAAISPVGYVGAPPTPTVATQRWQAATAGGRTSLLSADEQRDFARVYTVLARTEQRQMEEELAWSHLAALEGVARPSPDVLGRAREALGEARHLNYEIRNSILQAEIFASRIGIKGDADLAQTYRRGVQSTCVPIDTPRDRAAAITQNPSGAP